MTLEPIKGSEVRPELAAALALPEVQAVIDERDRLLYKQQYGVETEDELPEVPDHVEALISPDGKIHEPRAFPFPCHFPTYSLSCTDSRDFWRTNGNTGYDALLAGEWYVAVWKSDENPLTKEEWFNIKRCQGIVVDGIWMPE